MSLRPTRTRTRARRRGFTLIELLMVISIIGILAGIAIPAFSAARGSARRAQCQQNLHQIGLGLAHFSSAWNCYPKAGVIDESKAVVPNQLNRHTAVMSPSSIQAGMSSYNPLLYSWVVEVLPYIDKQELYSSWSKTAPFNSTLAPTGGTTSNDAIGNTSLKILRCPDDLVSKNGQGNLSYVCNAGFALCAETGATWAVDPATKNYSAAQNSWNGGKDATNCTSKLGVMFPGDPKRGYTTTPSSLYDGASNTILLGENILAGASATGTPATGGIPTNWACPLPQVVAFVGSHNVCKRGGGDCTQSLLFPTISGSGTQADGVDWVLASDSLNGTGENINYGTALIDKGSSPFANSAHSGGANFLMCDGSIKFLSSTIKGTVYSKLLSPAGGHPSMTLYRQLLLDEDDIGSR